MGTYATIKLKNTTNKNIQKHNTILFDCILQQFNILSADKQNEVITEYFSDPPLRDYDAKKYQELSNIDKLKEWLINSISFYNTDRLKAEFNFWKTCDREENYRGFSVLGSNNTVINSLKEFKKHWNTKTNFFCDDIGEFKIDVKFSRTADFIIKGIASYLATNLSELTEFKELTDIEKILEELDFEAVETIIKHDSYEKSYLKSEAKNYRKELKKYSSFRLHRPIEPKYETFYRNKSIFKNVVSGVVTIK